MNIAFPALFIFLLALPGIILRRSYREWGWRIPVYPRPLADQLAWSASFAAVLNILWCLLAQWCGYRINFGDVLILLTGGFGLRPELLAHRLEAITRHPVAIAAYFVSLYATAAIAGRGGRALVRGFRIDHRFKLLRFDNFWHYALNGEIPLFFENRSKYAEVLGMSEQVLAIVSCVVNHGARSFVYFGFPLEAYFDQFGKLEKIVVEGVSYEELRATSGEGTQASGETGAVQTRARLSIAADILVFNACDIHNIAIEYIFASRPEEQSNIEPSGYRITTEPQI
jgi:hypothetical protein